MKTLLGVCVLILKAFPAIAQQPGNTQTGATGVLESKVRKAWEDYKTKNKAEPGSLLADDFRIVQDGECFR